MTERENVSNMRTQVAVDDDDDDDDDDYGDDDSGWKRIYVLYCMSDECTLHVSPHR